MATQLVFDEKDLKRIGIVCPDCGTEAIFDLAKDQTANNARACPGCGKTDFLNIFQGSSSMNSWITYYKRGIEYQKGVSIRFYFE